METINPILIDACSLADDMYISEALAYYDSLPEFEYSEQFEKKMDKLCTHMNSGKYTHIPKPFKALLVAAIITALASAHATAIPSTSALVKNYYKDTNSKRTLLEYKNDVDTYGTPYSEYVIPDGYELVSKKQSDVSESCDYQNSDGYTLSFNSSVSENTASSVNTEGAIETAEIPMHGTTAFFVHGDSGFYYISFALGEYSYRIRADANGITKEEFLEIAKSRKNVYEEKFLGIF